VRNVSACHALTKVMIYCPNALDAMGALADQIIAQMFHWIREVRMAFFLRTGFAGQES
jgi:hypothetical protein